MSTFWHSQPPRGQVDDQQDWKLIEEGVDWVTVTAPIGREAEELYVRALAIVSDQEERGETRRSWRWQGYTGFRVPHVQTGFRVDGAILRLSGSVAEEKGRAIIADFQHVTRLDLQVTAVRSTDRGNVAEEGYRVLAERMHAKARPKPYGLILGSDGAATFTVGKRSDEVYTRVYNKTIESGGRYPANCWRYEVELKSRTAEVAAQRVLVAAGDDYTVSSEVYHWFLSMYVDPPWRDSSIDKTWKAPREMATVERQYRYLGTVGKRLVEKLTSWYSVEEILAAIGLMSEDDVETLRGASDAQANR